MKDNRVLSRWDLVLGWERVFLQMNLFLFCAVCARLIKISSVSCVREGGCKWGRPPYCLPLLSHSLYLWERSSYFSLGSDSSIHPDFPPCAHIARVLPFIHSEIPSIWMWVCFMHWGSSTSPWLHYERETEVWWREAAQQLTMRGLKEAGLTEVRMKETPASVKPFLLKIAQPQQD